MKTSKNILDDDYIGGQGALTDDEEKALSDYFRHKKLITNKSKLTTRHRLTKPKKTTV